MDLSEPVVGEAQGLQVTQRCGLDEEVRRCQEGAKRFAVGGTVLDVKDHASFVGICIDKGKAALWVLDIAGEGRKQPIGVAPSRLHFDDVSAQIGQETGSIGGGDVAQFDDPDVAEGRMLFGVGT